MAIQTSASAQGTERRLLLVDFDWQDADLMPELLQQPGVSVRLVAGTRHEDAGIRLAELCGLPRTLDLADLTREIFDLALVSERSPRRTQIEGLLLALGTPSITPQEFFSGNGTQSQAPAVEAPLALHAAAFENSVGGADFDTLMEHALPDVSDDAPTRPSPVQASGREIERVASLEDFPSPEDRQGLEAALRVLMEETGADRVEMHVVGPDQSKTSVEIGPADALLRGLVELSTRVGSPQVVGGLAGEQAGKAWGAWPFRTPQHHGVVAAAGIDPGQGWTAWERMVEELRTKWDERDRAQAGPAFPLLPGRHPRWLDRADFDGRLELAVERNRHDGLRFAAHRMVFPAGAEVVETMCDRLSKQLRDTDCMTRCGAQVIVILTAGAPDAFTHLQRRILALWDKVLDESGETRPQAGVIDEHAQLIVPADTPGFLGTTRGWMGAPAA